MQHASAVRSLSVCCFCAEHWSPCVCVCVAERLCFFVSFFLLVTSLNKSNISKYRRPVGRSLTALCIVDWHFDVGEAMLGHIFFVKQRLECTTLVDAADCLREQRRCLEHFDLWAPLHFVAQWNGVQAHHFLEHRIRDALNRRLAEDPMRHRLLYGYSVVLFDVVYAVRLEWNGVE